MDASRRGFFGRLIGTAAGIAIASKLPLPEPISHPERVFPSVRFCTISSTSAFHDICAGSSTHVRMLRGEWEDQPKGGVVFRLYGGDE